MQGGPVDELVGVAVERPVLDQLEVEVGRTPEKSDQSVFPVITGKIVTWTRSTRPAAIHAQFSDRLPGERNGTRAEAVLHASIDALTRIPNRRTLAAKMAREVSRAERTGAALTVLLLDLDGFKTVNDSRGHAAGDVILCDAVDAWSTRLRPNDLLARSGGDEFVIVAPDTTGDQALRLAARLRAATPPATGVSIGVAEWGPGDGVDELLARADREMYRVKARHRAA